MQAQFQIDGVDVHVEGQGPDTLVMLHGWPDSWRLWDAQVEHFKSRYRCVRFSLPGYEAGSPRRNYTLDDVVGLVGRVAERVSPDRPVTLLLHDWGCFFGYQYAVRNPARVRRVIALDVGDTTTLVRALSPLAGLLVFGYQIWLAAAWLVGGAAGDGMTRFMAWALGCKTDAALIGSRMCYPYFRFWTRGYSGQVQRYVPQCPMLYIYAKRKPVMFHDPAWLRELTALPHNRIEAFDTGHWVMQADSPGLNRCIDGWLSALPA